ncbi:hypothetical protein Kpho02_74570 [Kitasatospora phosalacinea]|uniref:Uncharacterized protein n=1 Tax=Kitasatospora phosalacinea TaxID=2065 RepID=A0A9W6QEX4_9ACTN|nr:hypothetical protein Kpho02_74570 [Kitasatospora phosalacinea]
MLQCQAPYTCTGEAAAAAAGGAGSAVTARASSEAATEKRVMGMTGERTFASRRSRAEWVGNRVRASRVGVNGLDRPGG